MSVIQKFHDFLEIKNRIEKSTSRKTNDLAELGYQSMNEWSLVNLVSYSVKAGSLFFLFISKWNVFNHGEIKIKVMV